MTTLRASLCLAALLAALPAAAVEPLAVARFSALAPGSGLPPGWELLRFPNIGRATEYRLVDDGGTVVLRADSRAAAAGLVRDLRADPAAYPVLEWRWKVAAPVPGVVGRRDADDFAARVYVGFGAGPDAPGAWERVRRRLLALVYGRVPPAATLNYVWAATEPEGTMAPSPFTGRVHLVVATSGSGQAGRWVAVRRDLAADYRRAFGTEPPEITGIGLMTDTDGTASAATAYYGDVVLRPRPAARRR